MSGEDAHLRILGHAGTSGVHRHRGLYWSAVLLALAALVGGSAFAYRAYEQTSGPDGAVKGYFAALSRSDALTVICSPASAR